MLDSKDVGNFREKVKTNGLDSFAHIPYLCNPASSDPLVYEKSKQMLVDNIKNCDALGIDYLVIHLGSHLGKGVDVGIENICNAVSFGLDSTQKVNILLENGSGYKNCVGSKFSELGRIIDGIDSARAGVCFDTCHAFAAGYDLRDPDAVKKTMEEFTSHVDISKLKLVHLNDAKYPLGSGLDRHFHIGKGNIGRKGFTALFQNDAFRNGSFIMELPEDSEGLHLDDMNAARSIMIEATEETD